MKKTTIFILFVIQTLSNAQNFSVYNIDTTSFPTVKANYFVFDANGKQVLNSSVNDFEIKEDGLLKTVTKVTCSSPKTPEILSSVLTMDISRSMKFYYRINIAMTAAKAWVDLLIQTSGQCAVTSFDDNGYLNQDFTKDKNKLYDAINKLTPDGGTDYNAGLLNNPFGALEISKNGKFKKIIIFLTDGTSEVTPEENKIIAEAQKQNCAIYSVVLGMNCPDCLKNISSQTGGLWYDNIITEEDAINAYKNIMFIAQNFEPCAIEWQSNVNCYLQKIKTDLKYIPFDKKSNMWYMPSFKSFADLKIEPPSVFFKNVQAGQSKDTIIKVTAVNSDFSNINISGSNSQFSIDKTNFSLAKGQSIDLKLSFHPDKDEYVYNQFNITTSLCSKDFFASGGLPGKKPTTNSLKLTFPNGGEKFILGCDTLITWEGIPATDFVQLDYSNDNGATWKLITKEASGLKYIWKKVPSPASNSCLIRIKQIAPVQFYYDSIPQSVWQKNYGSHRDDYLCSVKQTSDNGYIAVGTIYTKGGNVSESRGGEDVWVFKLNFKGELEWEKTYGGSLYDRPAQIIQTKDGGYIFCANTMSEDLDVSSKCEANNTWVVKLNSQGAVEWKKVFGEINAHICSSIQQTNDLGYAIGGYTVNAKTDCGAGWLLKLNPNGEPEWQQYYRNNLNNYCYAAKQTSDGGYILTGYTIESAFDSVHHVYNYNSDFYILKADSKGNFEWDNSYGGDIGEASYAIRQTSDGGYIAVGNSNSDNGDLTENKGGTDVWVIKTNSSGKLQWQKNYGGQAFDEAKYVVETEDGGFFIGCTVLSDDGDITDSRQACDYWLLKIDNLGNLIWQKNLGGSSADVFNDADLTNDGGYIVGGSSESRDKDITDFNGGFDCWLVKLSNYVGYIQEDISDSLFAVVEPKADADDIDMKKCLVGKSKDSLIAPFIQNIGSYKFRIDSIYFSGNDADCFSVVNGLPKYELSPNETHPTELCFKPKRVGIHSANIVIITQSGIIIKKIVGEGVINQVDAYSKIIDFGMVEIGKYKDTINCLTVKNLSSIPLNITNTKHNKPNDADFTTISGGGSFTLQSGEIKKMNLRFTPKTIGRTNGTLEFYYEGEGSPLVIQLFGQAEQCNGLSANYSSSDKQSMFMDSLIYGNTNCKYLTFTNKTDEQIIIDKVYLKKNMEFSTPLSQFPLIVNASDSVRLQICYSPLQLGKSTDTLVYSDLCDDKNITLSGFCKPNIYQALSNCNTELTIKTKKGNALRLFLPSPNPFSESTTIVYYAAASSEIELEIYNVYGEKINSIKQQCNEGMNSFVLSSSQFLSSGTYFCTFKAENEIKPFKLIFIK